MMLTIGLMCFCFGWFIGPAKFLWTGYILFPAAMLIAGAFCRFFWLF